MTRGEAALTAAVGIDAAPTGTAAALAVGTAGSLGGLFFNARWSAASNESSRCVRFTIAAADACRADAPSVEVFVTAVTPKTTPKAIAPATSSA